MGDEYKSRRAQGDEVADFWKMPREKQAVLAVVGIMYENCWVDKDVIIGKVMAMGLMRMSDEQFREWVNNLIAERKRLEGASNI